MYKNQTIPYCNIFRLALQNHVEQLTRRHLGVCSASFIILTVVKSALIKSKNSWTVISRRISISLSHSSSVNPSQRICTLRAECIFDSAFAFHDRSYSSKDSLSEFCESESAPTFPASLPKSIA